MICVFYAQTVWPSTLPHTNGLACSFYAQTVWPLTKLATQRVGVRIRSDTATPKKSYTATPTPPLHGRRPIHIVTVIKSVPPPIHGTLEITIVNDLPARRLYSASPTAKNNFLPYTSLSAPLRMHFLHCLLPLYLAHRGQYEKKMQTKKKHSQYRKDFLRSLSIVERHRWYRKILRCALIPLKLLPWQKLQALQNDQAYIMMRGFDCESFQKILEIFALMFMETHPLTVQG
jgi:hypothetical protein